MEFLFSCIYFHIPVILNVAVVVVMRCTPFDCKLSLNQLVFVFCNLMNSISTESKHILFRANKIKCKILDWI